MPPGGPQDLLQQEVDDPDDHDFSAVQTHEVEP